MATEEIKSLAVKIAIENGTFKQGIDDMKQNLKVFNSEFNASVAGVKDWGSNIDALKGNADRLGKAITNQKDMIKSYEAQLQKSKDALVTNSDKMTELKNKLDATKSAYDESKTAVGENDEATKKLKLELDALNSEYTHSESLVRKNNTSVNDYTIELNKAKGTLNGMEAALTQTNADIKNFGKLSDEAKAKVGEFANNVDRKVNSAIKGLAVGLAAAVAGMLALGKSSLSGASDLEGYRATLNVVMKDTRLAGETFKWAVDFANSTPFETDSVVQATVRLQSYGLVAKQVLPAIGDMAGVMGKDIMDAVEAVADAQTGELERMKEFGITKQMIIDKANETMKGKEIVNNQGQITDQANFNRALFALMDDKFKGGMEIQANSFKGLWSTVTGVFKTSLAQMMGITDEGEVVIGGAFDIIKGKIKEVAETLQRWSKDGTLKEIGVKVQAAFTGAVNFITNTVIPAFKFLFDNIGTIKTVVVGVIGAMTIWKTATTVAMAAQVLHNAQLIISAFLHGGLAAATGVATKAQWSLNAAMTANPIGLIIAAIAALVAVIGGLIFWYKKSSDAAKEASATEIAAAKEAREKIAAEHQKIYESKKSEIREKEASENDYYANQKAKSQKSYDDEVAIGEKKLSELKKNLSKRQDAEEERHKSAIKAIQDEFGVFEEKEKSKTEILQDEYADVSDSISDMLNIAKDAAAQEGEAFRKSSDAILKKVQSVHNEKMSMYIDEYLLSLGIIDDETGTKVKALQDEIAAIQKKTDDENAAIQAQADAEKLIDLQKNVDAAITDEERKSAVTKLQEEINRQNREKLLEQRKDQTADLNLKIVEAQAKATEEKGKLLTKLQEKIADEQIEIKKNTDYNISELQRERIEKEAIENEKYNAAKKSMDDQAAYFEDSWLPNYKKSLDDKLNYELAKEAERHNAIMANYEKEIDLAEPTEAKRIKALIAKMESGKSSVTATSEDLKYGLTKEKKLALIDSEIDKQKMLLHDMGIPGYASGTLNHQGGMAEIWEDRKGEIVNLPSGTIVIPNDISMQIAKNVGQSMGSRTSSVTNGSPILINIGTLVGSDGMNELKDILSRKMAGGYGLITGGNY